MYATYGFYSTVYNGSLIKSEDEWEKFAEKAASLIDLNTFGRIRTLGEVPNKVKLCECELCEMYKTYGKVLSGDIESENNDGYSVTYKSESDIKRALSGTVTRWLWDTGLMYRGTFTVNS